MIASERERAKRKRRKFSTFLIVTLVILASVNKHLRNSAKVTKELSCKQIPEEVIYECKDRKITLKRMMAKKPNSDIGHTCKMGQFDVPWDISIRSSGTVPNFFLAYSKIVNSKVNYANNGRGFVYEPTITNLMSLLINEEPCDHLSISIDIGGNIGWYAGFFTALGCQVVSVEAQGYATVLLNSTIKASHIDKSTCNDVWHRAVAGDSLGFVRMLGNTEGHGNAHSIGGGESRLPIVLVKGSTIHDIVQNSYICKHILQFSAVRVAMVKIDIEGSEIHALKSIMDLISTGKFRFTNIFVELSSPSIWLERSGYNFDEALEVFHSYFGLGFCLRKVIYSDCCKSVFKKKVDKECCKNTSSRMWPNWNSFNDVPNDLLGDVFLSTNSMKKYYENPSMRSNMTSKDPLGGDFFLSIGRVCKLGNFVEA